MPSVVCVSHRPSRYGEVRRDPFSHCSKVRRSEMCPLLSFLRLSLLFLVAWALLGRPFVASEVFTGLSLVVIGRIPLIQVHYLIVQRKMLTVKMAGAALCAVRRRGPLLLWPRRRRPPHAGSASLRPPGAHVLGFLVHMIWFSFLLRGVWFFLCFRLD
jgi:hypothetical protein